MEIKICTVGSDWAANDSSELVFMTIPQWEEMLVHAEEGVTDVVSEAFRNGVVGWGL